MKQSLPADAERQQTRQTQPVANPAHSENASSFVDNRPETLAQRKLKETIHASPKMIAQRKLAAAMNNSPRMVAQRKLHAFMNGSTRQLQAAPEEELLLQGKFAPQSPAQREPQSVAKPNNTGLPDNLKSGIEALSGLSMDSVRVHYNSSQPAQLSALAYAQGTDIHVAPGQEQHLPHEAWHVVQQAQGRVRPTMQMKDGVPVNDDQGLEHEADVMGERAAQMKRGKHDWIPDPDLRKHEPTAHGFHNSYLPETVMRPDPYPVKPVQLKKLVRDKLNIVGEYHSESGKNRANEKSVANKFAGGGYWREPEFKFNPLSIFSDEIDVDSTAADPILYRIADFSERLEINRVNLNRLYERTIVLNGFTEIAMSKKYEECYMPLFSMVSQNVADVIVQIDQLNQETSRLLKNKNEMGLLDENQKQIIWIIHAVSVKAEEQWQKLIDAYNAIPANIAAAKEDETFWTKAATESGALVKIIEKLEVFVDKLGYKNNSIELRDQAMNTAATVRFDVHGVWKIGNRHATAIVGKDRKRPFNLLTRNEFYEEPEYAGLLKKQSEEPSDL